MYVLFSVAICTISTCIYMFVLCTLQLTSSILVYIYVRMYYVCRSTCIYVSCTCDVLFVLLKTLIWICTDICIDKCITLCMKYLELYAVLLSSQRIDTFFHMLFISYIET